MNKNNEELVKNENILKKSIKLIGGRLDLSSSNLNNFNSIGLLSDLEVLIVADNNIESFITLKPQPNLKTIIATGNPIKYLTGLSKIKTLENLDISGSDLVKEPQFRPRVLATVGFNLLILNGEKLTQQDQLLAEMIIKRSPEKLFLPLNNEEDDIIFNNEEDELDTDDFRFMLSAHIEKHQKLYDKFAQNEAILYDLKLSGPLPFINENSIDEDLIFSILNLKKRKNLLEEKINEFQ